MNAITITGNVGSSELKNTQAGPVLHFSVADNQEKDSPATWYRCSLFGKRAEPLSKYVTKGLPVTVSGRLKVEEFEGKTKLNVLANDIALQGGKRDDSLDV